MMALTMRKKLFILSLVMVSAAEKRWLRASMACCSVAEWFSSCWYRNINRFSRVMLANSVSFDILIRRSATESFCFYRGKAMWLFSLTSFAFIGELETILMIIDQWNSSNIKPGYSRNNEINHCTARLNSSFVFFCTELAGRWKWAPGHGLSERPNLTVPRKNGLSPCWWSLLSLSVTALHFYSALDKM